MGRHARYTRDLCGTTTRIEGGVCNEQICVHKLVRFAGCYGGSYFCYNVEHNGSGTRECHLLPRRVLAYTRGNCTLNFHAFILRNKRSSCCSSTLLYSVITRVGTGCPSYTMALSINRHDFRDCGGLHLTNTSECLLHRRATSGDRCRVLRPPRVDFSGHIGYLCSLGSLNCRINTNFVINSPFRARSVLTGRLVFLQGLHPSVINVKPFIPRGSAPFTSVPRNATRLALFVLSLVELALPCILLPTAATLNAVSPLNERGNVGTKTGILVPGLSPHNMEGGCVLCSGGVYANSRTTRYVRYLGHEVRAANYGVVASENSIRGPRTGNWTREKGG